jgi:hypothetical protein
MQGASSPRIERLARRRAEAGKTVVAHGVADGLAVEIDKKLLGVLSSFSTAAQAHESLVPHVHPHGVSMLPGIDIVACGLSRSPPC